jgi:flavorubredoxin
MTERLILKHIEWAVSKIADEQLIADRHEQIMDTNISEIQQKYHQLYSEDADYYDDCDSPY